MIYDQRNKEYKNLHGLEIILLRSLGKLKSFGIFTFMHPTAINNDLDTGTVVFIKVLNSGRHTEIPSFSFRFWHGPG